MVYFVTILIYLVVLTGIGAYKSRQVKTEADFAVAGRSLSPWILVCTMLAVWIGTGSIVGNAEQTYKTGAAALIIPLGTFMGLILLSRIAFKARDIEVSTVPEIIGNRYGQIARFLAVIALIMAYMVIVSYQFNAGGAVLEVITGDKDPIALEVGDEVTSRQLAKGRVVFTPDPNYVGAVSINWTSAQGQALAYTVDVVRPDDIVAAHDRIGDDKNHVAIKANNLTRLRAAVKPVKTESYRLTAVPTEGRLELVEPKLTKEKATIIAAIFIIIYTMSAGLMSLAYTDIVTGSIITLSLLIAFPVLLIKAGGFDGMSAAFSAMADKPHHMDFWGVYKPTQLINYLLPPFLLIMGDANQYQRIFASRNAKGAKQAVNTMIFVALGIELLIIACAWVSSSMTPDPEDGKYILIYAAHHHMPFILGLLFMVTVVGIIISTADSFLLVPATTFINDVYLNYINPKANEKHTLLISRLLVVVFGVVAYLVTFAFAETTGFYAKALYAYTIYGSAITPCLIAALFWKRATKAGAIASILVGTATTLLWEEVIRDMIASNVSAQLAGLDAVLPAITLSVIALVGVSLLTGKKA